MPDLLEAAPVGGHVAGVADRDRERAGRLAELLDDLEGGGLLAFDPVRVDRVDELDRVLLGELADDRQGVVEVALQGDDAGAVHQRLGELADRDLALRDDHRAAHAGARGVGGGAGRGVAGRGADHRLRPAPLRPRDGDRHPPVLEAAGRVRPLELEVGAGADPLREPRRLDQRRRALLEADDRVAGLERQPVPVPLDQAPLHPAPPPPRSNELLLDHPDRARRRAHLVEPADLLDRGREAATPGTRGRPSPGARRRRSRAGRRSSPRSRCRRGPGRCGRGRPGGRRPRGAGRRTRRRR